MKRIFIVSAFALVVLTGCNNFVPTKYQPDDGFTGGYKDLHIRKNIYFLQFFGNGRTSRITAIKYFHRRAKELCKINGYKDYKVMSQKTVSQSNLQGFYGGGRVSTYRINTHTPTGYIKCLK